MFATTDTDGFTIKVESRKSIGRKYLSLRISHSTPSSAKLFVSDASEGVEEISGICVGGAEGAARDD
jgi:hypothetical protein